MKKLLTTLAVALVTASTHAAAISWSVDFSELGGAYEGYIAYLVTADQLAALTTDGLLDEDKWGGATLANMTLDKKGGNIMNVGDYSPGDTVTVYTILFKGPSVTAGVTEYMISTVSITDTFGTTGGISAGFVRLCRQ